MHRAAGARMAEWFGCDLPSDFGNPREEQRFARESVALIDKNYHAYLTFTGPDRVRYLNAVLTNDIKSLPIGHSNVSLLLNPQGRILAEIETYALPDRLLCVSHAMIRARLVEWLDKYIIMDDVTLADDTEQFGTLALEGPKTAELVRELTATDFAALPNGASMDTAVRNPESGRSAIPCRIVRRSPAAAAKPEPATTSNAHAESASASSATTSSTSSATIAGATIASATIAGETTAGASAEFICARKDLPALWKILEGAAKKAGGGPMGYSALSALRLVQGVPWFGYDFGEKQIPHEAGLQDSHISYSKGCYTGQEIVERVRSRGQVNRRRIGLVFANATANAAANVTAKAAADVAANAAANVPPNGASLTLDGTEVGFITRAARSFYPPAVLAMAYVRKEGSEPGTILDCAGEKAVVTSLPLSDPL